MVDVKKVSLVAVTALCGPSRFLWAGFDKCVPFLSRARGDPELMRLSVRSGMMEILDVAGAEWRVVKRWRGHRGTILSLGLDPSSLWTVRSLSLFLSMPLLDQRLTIIGRPPACVSTAPAPTSPSDFGCVFTFSSLHSLLSSGR